MKHEIIKECMRQVKTALLAGRGTDTYEIIEGALDKYEEYLLELQELVEKDVE